MRFSPIPLLCAEFFRWQSRPVFFLTNIPFSSASAYNAHPKLVVVIIIDQFRGISLGRYRTQFTAKEGSACSSTTARPSQIAITTMPTPALLPATPRCSRAPTATDTALLRTSGGIREKENGHVGGGQRYQARWQYHGSS